MQAKNLCFYLSDHGFGHIARNIPLIAEAVRRIDAYVYVVCGKRHLEFAKANLLELLTPEQFSRIRYRAEHTDIGLILQQGTLLVDTVLRPMPVSSIWLNCQNGQNGRQNGCINRRLPLPFAICRFGRFQPVSRPVCRCSMWEISHGRSCTGSFCRNTSGKRMPQSTGRYGTGCFMRCTTRKCWNFCLRQS